MRGIIAAEGAGTRIRPALDKMQQLVYDKPLLYYLLSNLMKAGGQNVLVACNEQNISAAQTLLRNASSEFGVDLMFTTTGTQAGPAGIFRSRVVRQFIGDEPVCLTLDGIYHGGNFDEVMRECAGVTAGATVLAAQVPDPRPLGWFKMDERGHGVVDIIEKPKLTPTPGCSYLVQTGIYAYGPEVVDYADRLQPSARGEYEVTDLHKLFLDQDKLSIKVLSDSDKQPFMWNDPGTPARILSLAIAVRDIQERTPGCLVGSPHLQALKNGWVTAERILEICATRKSSAYYDALVEAVAMTSRERQ